MFACITVIVYALIWLLYETDCLRIRLPYGKADNKTYLLPVGKPMILIAQNCELTLFEQGRYKVHNMAEWDIFRERFASFYKREEQARIEHDTEVKIYNQTRNCPICKKQFEKPTIGTSQHTIGNSTITVTGCPTCTLKYRDELFKIQTVKHKPTQIHMKFPERTFVRHERIGSHKEIDNNPVFRHPINRTVEDYKTFYDNCLVSKEWLEAHYQDIIPEPTIELIVDGKEPITFNGNYKKGIIKEYLALNKK